jgi:hypothetical protein
LLIIALTQDSWPCSALSFSSSTATCQASKRAATGRNTLGHELLKCPPSKACTAEHHKRCHCSSCCQPVQ